MKNLLRVLTAIILSINLAACGLGSSSDNTTISIVIPAMDDISFNDNDFIVSFSLDGTPCNVDQDRYTNCGALSISEHSYEISYKQISTGNPFATASGKFLIRKGRHNAPVLNDLIYTEEYNNFLNPVTIDPVVTEPKAEVQTAIKLVLPKTNVKVGEKLNFTVEFTNTDQVVTTIQKNNSDLLCRVENSAFAQIEGTQLSAMKEGSTKLICNYLDLNANAAITITPATLESLSISPLSPMISIGDELFINVSGNYSDESTKELNSEVEWLSNDTNIVEITIENFKIKLAGKSPGNAIITASLNGINAEITVQVLANQNVLSKLYIQPYNLNILLNSMTSLNVAGIYSNNTSDKLTDQVSWRSMDDTIVSVSDTIGSKGVVTALGEGDATIEASIDGISHQVLVSVFDRRIDFIEIELQYLHRSPGNTLAVGTSFRYKAIARFADGFSQDITESADWDSSDQTAFTVYNLDKGKVTAIGTGTAAITAAFNGKTGVLILNAINSPLDSVFFMIKYDLMPVGLEADNHISTNFIDGQVLREIRENVSWSSSDTSVAEVDKDGVVTAKFVGTTTIKASILSKSASYELTVDNSKIVASKIATVLDIPALDIGINRRQQLSAQVNYDNGILYDVTDQATWDIENDSIAAVTTLGSTIGSRGSVSGITPGETPVVAHFLATRISNSIIVKNEDCGSGPLVISNINLAAAIDTNPLLDTDFPVKVTYTGEYSQLFEPSVALQFDMGPILFSSVKSLPSPFTNNCTMEFTASIPAGKDVFDATGVDLFVESGVTGEFILSFRILDNAVPVTEQWDNSPGSNIVTTDTITLF